MLRFTLSRKPESQLIRLVLYLASQHCRLLCQLSACERSSHPSNAYAGAQNARLSVTE